MKYRAKLGCAVRRLACLSAVAAGLAGMSGAMAAEYGATVDAGLGYSDNIDTAPSGQEIEETMSAVGLNLLYLEDKRRFDADVRADLMYVEYFEDTFESEVLGNAAGDLMLGVVPERFQWQISDNFGQVRQDILAPASPRNRENINVFETGPDLLFRLGARTGVRLSARYSRTDLEESIQDEQSRNGSIALTRELSGGSALSLVAEASRYDYEEEAFADSDRRNAYLNYELTGSRTTLGLDLGYTVVDFGEENDNDGLLARLRLSRRVSASSTVSIGAGTHFSASGDVFRASQRRLSGRDDGQLALAVSDVFRSTYADVGWTFARTRTDFSMSVSHSKEEYERQSQFDRDLTTVNALFRRAVGASSSLDLGVRYDQEEFESGIDSKTLRLSTGFSREFGRHIVLSVRALRHDRNSHQTSTEYVENQAWFTVGYRMGYQE